MNTIGRYLQNSYRISNNLCFLKIENNQSQRPANTNKGVSDIKRILSNMRRENQGMSLPAVSTNTIFDSAQSYSEMLMTQRQQAKDTALKLKKLKYQFKNISSKILRSKTSTAARRAASQARREVLRLKREKQNGNYDNEEIDAAITHAKAMERVARKKAKHLEEEEMAKSSGGPCAGNMVEEEETEEIQEDEYEANEEILEIPDGYGDEQEYIEIEFPDIRMLEMYYNYNQTLNEMDAVISDMIELTSEMFDEFSEGMKEMLEDMGLDELSDEFLSVKGDMDPADLKAMKIKHRNKEMKDIVKADAEYLKVVFAHLEKMKDGGVSLGCSSSEAAAVPSAMPAVSPGGNGMPLPVIDIAL